MEVGRYGFRHVVLTLTLYGGVAVIGVAFWIAIGLLVIYVVKALLA